MNKILLLLTLSSCLKFIIGIGTETSGNKHRKENAFIKAIEEGNKDVAIKFVEKGIDINYKDFYDWSPIMYACWKEQYDVVKLLIKKGVDINGKVKCDFTPLQYFCRTYYGNEKIIEMLLNLGSLIDAEDNQGRTPLMLSLISPSRSLFEYSKAPTVEQEKEEKKNIAKLLIKKGADINHQDIEGKSVFKYAYSNSNYEILIFLLKNGVKIKSISLLKELLFDKNLQEAVLDRLIKDIESLNLISLAAIYKEIKDNKNSYQSFYEINNEELKDILLEHLAVNAKINNIFSLDNFTFSKVSLLTNAFLSSIESYELITVKEIKNLKKEIIKLFLEYYNEKLEAKENYQENFKYSYNEIKKWIDYLSLNIVETRKSFKQDFTNRDLIRRIKEIIAHDRINFFK